MPGSCDRCGSENPSGRRYCWGCGARLASVIDAADQCTRCGFCNDPSHHWCGGCGLALAADMAEWRQLTVMFCDLAGSTAMSTVLDPEDLREVNRAYQETVTAAIERFKASEIAGLLGADWATNYALAAETEVAKYTESAGATDPDEVTDWERARYLPIA